LKGRTDADSVAAHVEIGCAHQALAQTVLVNACMAKDTLRALIATPI